MTKQFLTILVIILLLNSGCNNDTNPVLAGKENTIPSIPKLVQPEDSVTDVVGNIVLIWTQIPGAINYTCQVSKDTSFAIVLFNQSVSKDTHVQITGLDAYTKYYWRVNAINDAGASAWSQSVFVTGTTATTPIVPEIAAPANKATNLYPPLIIAWKASLGANDYTFQVSTDSMFASVIYSEYMTKDTSRELSILNAGTTYYWRVSAKNDNGISPYSQVYIFSTGTKPSAPILSLPLNGAIDQLRDIKLSWDSKAGAAYTLQVAMDSTFTKIVESAIGITESSRQISNLNIGTTYYWRVLATNYFGKSEFSDVSHFTTGFLPAIPILSRPSNGANNQLLQGDLNWESVPKATRYTVQLSLDSNFLYMIFRDSTITGTSVQYDRLMPGTIYYWRVCASNDYGSSLFSIVFNFSTGTIPSVPTLLNPVNYSTDQLLLQTLNWNGSSDATNYNLQVSTSSSFSSFVLNSSTLTTTSYQLKDLSIYTKYYWRVSATNSFGSSAFSNVFSFLTGQKPPVPLLKSPYNEEFAIILTPKLSWYESSGAKNYRLQVSRNSTFTDVTHDIDSIPGTSYVLDSLNNHTTYYWRVCANNSFGTSAFSSTFSFATIILPTVPVLSLPIDGATNQLRIITLSWNTSSYATNYTLQVSTSSAFSTFVYNLTVNSGATCSIGNLKGNTRYYWRVSAANNSGSSAFSSIFSFVIGPPPDAPILLQPADGTTNQSKNSIVFSWNPSPGATSYNLSVSADRDFSTQICNYAQITNTSFEIGPIGGSATYYWRVSANNDYATSDNSDIYSFTTQASVNPGVPCPGEPTITYEGRTYNTILFGSQCWLKENLNVGTQIYVTLSQADNGIIEKYCYDGNASNCETYGGLYQWAEAIQYKNGATNNISPNPSFAGNVQGICPTGWHIPNSTEMNVCINAVSGDGNALKAVGQGFGGGAGTNMSGFSGLLAGSRALGVFTSMGLNGNFWSSSEHDAGSANFIYIYNATSTIGKTYTPKESMGYSVRCLKD